MSLSKLESASNLVGKKPVLYYSCCMNESKVINSSTAQIDVIALCAEKNHDIFDEQIFWKKKLVFSYRSFNTLPDQIE